MGKKVEKVEIIDDDIVEYFKKETKAGKIASSDNQKFISTGSTWLDYCIANRQNGGVPVGRITEICGNEACVTEDTEIEVIIED